MLQENDNIFKSMKDITFEDTISHQCGVTMNDSVEARAIADVMSRHAHSRVTYMPAMIRIDGKAKGEEFFVIDGRPHFWDGSPANQKNIHGKQFIECFYAYHSNLSPPSEKWEKEKFEKYDAKTMFDDLFVTGYDDMAILQPTYLTDFYKNGFNTTERNSAMKKNHPDRFILNGP